MIPGPGRAAAPNRPARWAIGLLLLAAAVGIYGFASRYHNSAGEHVARSREVPPGVCPRCGRPIRPRPLPAEQPVIPPEHPIRYPAAQGKHGLPQKIQKTQRGEK